MLYQPMSSPQRIRMFGCLVAMRRLLLASRVSYSACTATGLPAVPTFASPGRVQGAVNLPPLNRPRNGTKVVWSTAAHLRDNVRSARDRPASGPARASDAGELAAPPRQIHDRDDQADEEVQQDRSHDPVLLREVGGGDRERHARMPGRGREREHHAVPR